MPYRIYFYRTDSGRCEVRDFLWRLPLKPRLKCLDYLRRVRQQGTRLPANIIRHLEQGLWEARPEYGGIEYRFFFFLTDTERIGIVSALVKKKQKLERRVIEQALQRTAQMRQKWQEEDNA